MHIEEVTLLVYLIISKHIMILVQKELEQNIGIKVIFFVNVHIPLYLLLLVNIYKIQNRKIYYLYIVILSIEEDVKRGNKNVFLLVLYNFQAVNKASVLVAYLVNC